MPKLALALVLLALAALAGSMSYAGYLVVSMLADHLGTGRLLAGLLLGIIFARLPSIREGKLRTIGLLPKPARRPVMLALLAFCIFSYLYRGEPVPVLFLSFAAAFLLAFPSLRKTMIDRTLSSLFSMPGASPPPKREDDTVIDVEFREKKD